MSVDHPSQVNIKRKLSSSLETIIFKFIFPVIFLTSLAASAINEYVLRSGRERFEIPWLFFIFFLPMVIFFFWLALSIKSVAIDDNTLYVSNYFKEARIPLAEIAKIRETNLIKPKIITIELKSSGKFGDKIRFIPIWGLALSEIKRAI